MKKSLHRFFAAMLMALVAVAAQAQCFIIGNDNQWVTNKAGAELQSTGTYGVYEGEVSFSNASQWFFITTKLTSSDSDWDGISSYRYGPAEPYAKLKINEPMDMFNPSDISFMVPFTNETYRIRVDFNAGQVTLLGEFPDELYIIGSDAVWVASVPAAVLSKTAAEGVYEGSVVFTNSWNYGFLVASKIGDWGIISQNRYTSSVCPLRMNRFNPLEKGNGSSNIMVPYLGTFEVTVDLKNMLIKVYDPNYVPEYPDAIYIHGTDGKPVANEGVELEWNDVEGVYTGWVNFTSDQFNISTDLASTADGWEEISSKRIGASTVLQNVETELSVPLVKGEPSNFTINASSENNLYACVTVDLRKGRMTIFGNDETYPVGQPKEMYILGSDGNWFPRIPSDYVSATSEPGVYEGDITFTGDKDDLSFGHFAVLQRLGMNWDWINAKRLSPYSDGDWIALGDYASVYTGSDTSGAWKFTGDPGTYKIKVDLSGTGYVLISEKPATGISAAPTATAAPKTFYYDLNGRFLGNTEPQKGTFVVKGKKTVLK